MNKKTLLRVLIFVILVALIIWVGVHHRDQLELAKLEALLKSYGWWAPFIFICIYIAATVLFLPGAALTIAGGFLFGPFLGTLYNLIGAVIGCSLAFLISRYLAGDWIAQRTGKRVQQLMLGVKHGGWKFVAILRLVPIFPFNILNYALGLTPIKAWHFILASAIFMIPGTFAYTYVGTLGKTALAGQAQQIAGQSLIVLGLLILVGALPWLIRHFKKTATYLEDVE